LKIRLIFFMLFTISTHLFHSTQLSFQEYCMVEEETGGAGLWENPVVVSVMRALTPDNRARYEQV
jgi:hypothetical protein